jgi:hypothetical protein
MWGKNRLGEQVKQFWILIKRIFWFMPRIGSGETPTSALVGGINLKSKIVS